MRRLPAMTMTMTDGDVTLIMDIYNNAEIFWDTQILSYDNNNYYANDTDYNSDT